jgi:hypothetical protein
MSDLSLSLLALVQLSRFGFIQKKPVPVSIHNASSSFFLALRKARKLRTIIFTFPPHPHISLIIPNKDLHSRKRCLEIDYEMERTPEGMDIHAIFYVSSVIFINFRAMDIHAILHVSSVIFINIAIVTVSRRYF